MSSSSTVGLGFPRLISSKKATVDGPNTGNGPISDCVEISRSPNCKTPTLLNVFFLFYQDGGVAKGILRKFQFL